jgi:gamma-glutamylcyclotransferase (GGCT)/AIG2-like uncharacterized protein YtfP
MNHLLAFSTRSVNESLSQFNKARDLMPKRQNKVAVCDLLFKGLNALQTEWLYVNRIQSQAKSIENESIGEVGTFKEFISSSLNEEDCNVLLKSKEFLNFVDFHPHILNHDVLRRNYYDREKEIPPEIERKALEKHQKLQNAFKRFKDHNTMENQKVVIKKMADLLYVVRSNIMHGGKSPSSGPYHQQIKRDEVVSGIVIPLQLLLFKILLENPTEKLFVYGSLAPGQPNHRILSDLQGTWTNCKIKGWIMKMGGLQYFNWDTRGDDIEVQLFTSSKLHENWEFLDRFEGTSYKRHLITGKLQNNEVIVANIYLAPEPDL